MHCVWLLSCCSGRTEYLWQRLYDPQRQKDLPPCPWRESLQPLTYSYQLYIWGLNPGLAVIFSVCIIWHILKGLLSVKHQEIGRQIEVIPATRAVSLVGIIGTQILKVKVRKTYERMWVVWPREVEQSFPGEQTVALNLKASELGVLRQKHTPVWVDIVWEVECENMLYSGKNG